MEADIEVRRAVLLFLMIGIPALCFLTVIGYFVHDALHWWRTR